MDLPRARPARRRSKLVLTVVGALAGLLSLYGFSRLHPAGPEIERATLLVDRVRRGPMVRQVHANGTLVPEEQHIVSALTAGRVDRVLARAGTRVEAHTVLVELSNPDVQLEALDAERQLELAQAELAGVHSTLESARLSQRSAFAAARAELHEAQRLVAVSEKLAAEGLTATMDVDRARDRLANAEERFDAEQRLVAVSDEALRAQLALRGADIGRLRAIARFQRDRVASMRVEAGGAGLVQALDLEPGQWVQSGQRLARVASPDRLKAVLLVPESQARDVTMGRPVVVDTRDGLVRGRVTRVDPAVQNNSVAVDVALEGPLPRGARPDLSVDGTIEIERLADVLSLGRPASGASETATRLFRVERDGHSAVRVPVRLGRASFNAVEVLGGLQVGDEVILSEMDRWDGIDRVRLR
jgi:HlyD family secretion protein